VIAYSDTGAPLSPTELSLCRQILGALAQAYPAMAPGWTVALNPGGVVKITNRLLSSRFGVALHTSKIDPEMRKVRRYAGEMLERYRVLASARSAQGVTDTLATARRDARGELEHDT